MKCKRIESEFQPYPQQGYLAKNSNLSLKALLQAITNERTIVYCYIIATVQNRNGYFVQRGSGPNFQGGLITLCTCKHYMRTFWDVSEWKGKWVAGFSGVKAGKGANALFYLMRIAYAFESHHELWTSKTISSETKTAKEASINKFGDVFQPKDNLDDPFDPKSYDPPVDNHVHSGGNKYYGDINYIGCSGRRAALLVGDRNLSFLWNKPMLCYPLRIPRGQMKGDLNEIIHQLTEPTYENNF